MLVSRSLVAVWRRVPSVAPPFRLAAPTFAAAVESAAGTTVAAGAHRAPQHAPASPAYLGSSVLWGHAFSATRHSSSSSSPVTDHAPPAAASAGPPLPGRSSGDPPPPPLGLDNVLRTRLADGGWAFIPPAVLAALSLEVGSSMDVNRAAITRNVVGVRRHKQDSGSSETHAKDHVTRRSLVNLVAKRRRVMQYLLRKDPDAYKRTVTALNLRPGMVSNPDVGSRGAKKHPTLALTRAPPVGGADSAMPAGAEVAST